MPEAVLDSSVVIGLCFRHTGERMRCAALVPAGATVTVSAYVVFEVARGFISNLILLHNLSWAYKDLPDLSEAARSGQTRFRHHRMHTFLGAIEDFGRALRQADGPVDHSKELVELRAYLRMVVRRGWSALLRISRPVNRVGCREDLLPPFQRSHDKHLHQELPTDLCGQPESCGLDRYLNEHATELAHLGRQLATRAKSGADREVDRRVGALERLATKAPGEPFKGKDCYSCGDAFICHEAPAGAIIVTKNHKHFEPVCEILGKFLVPAPAD